MLALLMTKKGSIKFTRVFEAGGFYFGQQTHSINSHAVQSKYDSMVMELMIYFGGETWPYILSLKPTTLEWIFKF